MNINESVKTAISEIFLHKLRSFLTILGVIFGVGSVIAMMSIGAGAEKEAVRQIEEMGARNITVKAKKLTGKDYKEAVRKFSKGLSVDDVDYIKKTIPVIVDSAPQIIIDEKAGFGKLRPECNIVGIDTGFFRISGKKIRFGRFINNDDLNYFRKVCVLGAEIAEELFYNHDPQGKIIRIGNERFVIIGTVSAGGFLKKDNENASGNNMKLDLKTRNMERDIYIPATLSDKLFPVNNRAGFENSDKDPEFHEVSEVVFTVKDIEDLAFARDSLNSILKRKHSNIEDFDIIIPLEKLEQKKETQRIFNIVMTGIAALSLLVGGIGIMNIMLASVSERTKEIGVRRAIGANGKDIMMQFVIEALVLSIIGGLLGVLAGILISYLVSYQAGWETVVTFTSIFLAFGVSALTGIISGIFPAYSASKMDPVECLRYE
ncbi:MAG: ABC transporter permease [Candidatus Muirbacterium halophilum]|nr:ABC transporter permease [Candidatus Muirbacterium halophilum]MCK9474979.1 ABC transporter permease [Candidatus Muirbacterium halophilum]